MRREQLGEIKRRGHADGQGIHEFLVGAVVDAAGDGQRVVDDEIDVTGLADDVISEALERDKFKYYDLLNGIRAKNDWGSWIDFFLRTVEQQCSKYIQMVDQINQLYETDLARAKELIRTNKVVDLINLLYQYPVITTAIVTNHTGIPPATATRYLNILTQERILYTDGKMRNRIFFYYDLLNVIRG